MEPVREILLMLILRKRAAERVRNLIDRTLVPKEHVAYIDGKCEEAATACQIARTTYQLSRGRSPHVEEELKRVIATSAEREEFVTFSDGYVHFWPSGSPHGALSAWHLRVLADELDRRNHAWDAHVRKAFEGRVS